jgi:hypothetical protein
VVGRPISSKPENPSKPVIINNYQGYNRPGIGNIQAKPVIANNKYKQGPPLQKVGQQQLYINRPISSKVDQKIAAANHGLKKMPDVRPVGNQIKISEKIIKNNAAVQKNYGYNNKYTPVKVGYNNGPRIMNIKK